MPSGLTTDELRIADQGQEAPESFDPVIFARLFELESRHFWFRARNKVIAAVVKKYNVIPDQDARVIEIGCGNGNVLSYLSRTLRKEIWGADLFAEALTFCQTRVSLPLIQLDTYRLPFVGSLDAVCMFDILEHLRADTEVLAEIYRALKPGGKIVLTVPAYQKLWSYFDEFSHHQRRYNKVQLRRKLEAAGFEIEKSSYYMMTLLPLIAVGRKIQNRQNRSTDDMAETDIKVIPVVNELLYLISSFERWFVSTVGLPFGASIIVVGRRR